MKRNEVEHQEPQAPSTNDLPLDEAALRYLAGWKDGDPAWYRARLDLSKRWGDEFAAMGELAESILTLRARVAELEQRERDSDKAHACQVARVEILLREKAELEGEIATVRMNADAWEAEADSANALGQSWRARATAPRSALESGNRRLGYWCDLHGSLPEDVSALAGMQAALASTPAADLAAYRKSVLEEAAKECEHGIPCGPTSNETEYGYNRGRAACAKDIRALAAQEVTK